MGGGISTPKPESMAQVLQAYAQYLPGLVSATAAQQPGIAQNQFNATMATQPLYNALNLQQAQQYGVPLAQAGQQVTRSNALAGGETQLAQMQNTGAQTAQTADAIARAANPNYYGVQDKSSAAAAGLTGQIPGIQSQYQDLANRVAGLTGQSQGLVNQQQFLGDTASGLAGGQAGLAQQVAGLAGQYQGLGQAATGLAGTQAGLAGRTADLTSGVQDLYNQNEAQRGQTNQMWDKASQMMNSINLSGLSPGEQNAVERSLNQSNTATGNLGLDNATNAVSNAMNFGNAYQQKLGQMANAINSGAQAFGTGQQLTGTGSNLINLGGNLYNSAGQQLGAAGQQLSNAANIYGAGAGQYGQASNMLGQSAGTLGQAGNLYGNAQSGIGQMGNLYGQAGQLGTQGISNATNILGAANQTATSAQNTGWNPINLAIGQPNASTMGNFGTGTFSNTSANTQNASGQNAFGFGQGLMGNMSSMNNAFTGAAAQQAAANTGMMGSMASAGISSACCWIFMEAYKGLMPKFVRSSRDWYYVAKPDMATGYRRVACWLVPAMRHSATVRWLVWNLMVSPITQYLGAVNKQKGYKRTAWNKAVTRFWLTSWTKLGKGHTEAEYLKSWMTKIA